LILMGCRERRAIQDRHDSIEQRNHDRRGWVAVSYRGGTSRPLVSESNENRNRNDARPSRIDAGIPTKT
jgi:hypothetical protein